MAKGVIFEQNGFFKECYQNGKYIGCINLEEMDRVHIGYIGKRTEIAEEDIKFKTKVIKKGTEFQTILYPLNGKILKNDI